MADPSDNQTLFEDAVTIERYELRPRLLEVAAIEQLSQVFIRITLTGDELAGFRCSAPCDHVKIFFPAGDAKLPVMPTIDADGRIKLPGGESKPIHRDFTIRHFRSQSLELDLDFFLHDHGVAADWVRGAKTGDKLGVGGPRGSKHVRRVFDWYLLGGDETAVPALARWIESLGSDDRAIVMVECGKAGDIPQLPAHPGVEIHELHRGESQSGSSALIDERLRSIERPSGSFYTWVGGEAGAVRPVRKYLRDGLGIDPRVVNVEGYWRLGTENFDHHAPDPEDA